MSTTNERTVTITVRMPASVKDQLEELARVTGRQRTYLALEAIRQYLAVEAWQVADIREAIARADAGEFATDEQVAAVRHKFQAMGSA
jgi:predicted transcriptional regulator